MCSHISASSSAQMDFGCVVSAGFVSAGFVSAGFVSAGFVCVCGCACVSGNFSLTLPLIRSAGEVPRQSNHEVDFQFFSNCQVSSPIRQFQYSKGLTSGV